MEKELRNITLRRLTTFWKKVKKFIDTKANSENYDYSLDYFTTVNIDKIAGTFNVYVGANEPLSYSLDDGVTWVTMSDGTAGRKATPSIKPGEKVLWKNTNIYPVHYMAMTSPKIDSTMKFAVLGNLMSFIFGDDFIKDTYVITNTGSTNFAYFFGLKLKYAHNLIFPKSISSTDPYVYTIYGNMFTSCSGLVTPPKELSNIICAGLYSGMFSGCTSLTSTPILPYTNITTNCYSSMFYGCTSLTKAPDLPATAAAIGCYANMFVNCTSLKEAPLINLEGLAAFMCMYQMFKGCTSLIKGPDTLKLTSLSGYTIPGGSTVVGCYESMFEGCTSLVEAPDILAASVANSEFRCMFMNCTSLKHMPYMALIRFGARLSHYLMFKGCTSLQEANIQGVGTGQGISYQCTSMFEGCTSLTKATVKVGASGAGNFNNMFKGCTNLSFIEGFFGTPPTNTSDWVNGVAATGIFIKKDNASWDVIGDSGVPFNWLVYSEEEYELVRLYQLLNKADKDLDAVQGNIAVFDINGNPIDSGKTFPFTYADLYLTLEALEDTIFKFLSSSYNNIQYSTDNGVTWSEPANLVDVAVSAGSKILWKGNMTSFSRGIGRFRSEDSNSSRKKFNVEGNIMSLLYGDNFRGLSDISTKAYVFYDLFDYSYVVDASNLILPSTVSDHAYYYTFRQCSELIKPPKLPATVLAPYCYDYMFYSCTKLKEIPELPATALAEGCYAGTFADCRQLNGYVHLPAETLVNYCYEDMFSLVGRPIIKLDATNIIQGAFLNWSSTAIVIKKDNYEGISGNNVYTESEWKVVRHYELSSYYTKPNGGIPKTDLSTDVQTSLGKADTALQSFTETDPTVPAWAKQPTKPSYTASEVGALPDTTKYAGSQSAGGAANKAVSIPFGQVDSTSTNTAFTATVDGITELRDGVCCYLRNGVINSANGCTLDINELGAKPIYYSFTGQSITSHFQVTSTMLFVYNTSIVNSGCWILSAGYDSNSNDVAWIVRRSGGTYKAKEALNPNQILFTYSDDELLPTSRTRATTPTKELTTLDFDPFGAIYMSNNSAVVAQGADLDNAYIWLQRPLDIRYAFNVGTLTSNKAVYVKCSPLANGRVVLATDTQIYQELPTTEDGYVYIYLGMMQTGNLMQFTINHPIYYFKDGAIRQWTGEDSRISALEARNDSTYGVVRQTITFTDVAGQGRIKAISNIERGYIPNMFIKIATLGKGMATFNSTTGYFELNGLTDISYEEMVVIYNETKDMLKLGQASQWAILANSNARTNLTTNNENNQLRSLKVTFSYGFQYSSNLEVLNLDLNYGEGDETKTVVIGKSGFSSTFVSCGVLRTILGKLNVSVDNSMFNYDTNGQSYTFQACTSLENIQLYGLRQNVSFRYCQPLSVESILYMINNEAATGAIRITLNTYAYQRAIVNADIVAATQNHPLITLADYTTGNTFNSGVETTALD